MTEYPLLVRDFSGDKALTIICQRCGAERVIHSDEIYNEDIYECPADTELARRASTKPRCCGTACMKYEEGVACANCGKLDYAMALDERWCSRVCQLQGEYAAKIAAAEENR